MKLTLVLAATVPALLIAQPAAAKPSEARSRRCPPEPSRRATPSTAAPVLGTIATAAITATGAAMATAGGLVWVRPSAPVSVA